VDDATNAQERHDPQLEAAEESKKRARLIALAILLIPVLAAVLPLPYKAFVPFLFLIPLFMSLANKFRKGVEKSGNALPAQSPSMPDKDHYVEPYFYEPKDPKDPRRYKPIE
jgi:hypothetical protein